MRRRGCRAKRGKVDVDVELLRFKKEEKKRGKPTQVL